MTRSTVPCRMRVACLDAPRDLCVADEPGHRLPLERGGEAFAVASRGEKLKVIVEARRPEGPTA